VAGQPRGRHRVKVHDPYRWLEDIDSPETLAWIEERNEVTFGYLEAVPGRERIRKRMTELWDLEVRHPLQTTLK